VKLAHNSGKKKRKEYFKANIDEFENNSKVKNMGDFYGVSVFLRRVNSLELI
jgi:hypothetical protein